MDNSTASSGRVSLPFTPFADCVEEFLRRRDLTLSDYLDGGTGPLRKAYYRAATAGQITLDAADTLCIKFGWHPRMIWAEAWDAATTEHMRRRRARGLAA